MPFYDVTVYTSCAKDYIAWKNEYEPGTEDLNGVHIKRFAVAKERNMEEFVAFHFKLMNNPEHSMKDEEKWIDMQGPYCPSLLETLEQEHTQYHVVLFMTYLYYFSALGLPKGFENAVLIPTVHDEPSVYYHVYDKVFNSAKAFVWNTPEERAFAQKRFPLIVSKPETITGLGIDKPECDLPPIPEELKGENYLVYAGRIEESKGCIKMFEFFLHFRKQNPETDIKLVLMGKAGMVIPDDPNIISLGFVSDEMKYSVMKHSLALTLFSQFESLSMVVLESMMMGRPVLVTGQCEVLKGHCIRSNAGLYFDNYPEFEFAIQYFLTHKKEYEAMCVNGEKYVEVNYRWEVVTKKYCELINRL